MNYDYLLQKYSKDTVERAIKILSYKEAVQPLPKSDCNDGPILYVFRHGQTVDNADFVFSGWRNSLLTKAGREQALELATKLCDKKIDYLIASPQIRAVETLQLAMSLNLKAKDLEIHTDERIKERCYGDFQGKSKLEVFLENEETLRTLRRTYDYIPPKGESIAMVVKRVTEFCDWLVDFMKKKQMNVVVSCHGNSIRGIRKYFEKLDNNKTATIETPLGQDYAAYCIA